MIDRTIESELIRQVKAQLPDLKEPRGVGWLESRGFR
jgi:hypothetical protein